MYTCHTYNNDVFIVYRYGFKTVELNGENEKNQWAENQIHTYLTTRVSYLQLFIKCKICYGYISYS